MYGNQFGAYPFMMPQMGQSSPFIPQFNQQQTPVQQQESGPVVLYANTVKDFPNVSVQPGRQALVISQNDPYIAFKSADTMGMVDTKIYKISLVSEEEINGPSVEYATKDELTRLESVVNRIIDALAPKAGKETEKA